MESLDEGHDAYNNPSHGGLLSLHRSVVRVARYHRSVKSLGSMCTSKFAFFAVVEDGPVMLDDRLTRLALSPSLPRHEAILEFLDRLSSELIRISPGAVGVFKPTYSPRMVTAQMVGAASARGALEALVEVAVARQSLAVQEITHQGIRGRLELPREGSLDEHVPAVFPTSSPPYWNERRIAAMTAASLLS